MDDELKRLRTLVRRIKRIVRNNEYTDGNMLHGFILIQDALKDYEAKKANR